MKIITATYLFHTIIQIIDIKLIEITYTNFCNIVSKAFLTVGSFKSLLCGSCLVTGGAVIVGDSDLSITVFSLSIFKILCCRSTCVLLVVGAGVNGSPSSILYCCSLRS